MVVDFFTPQGTSLEETDAIARRLDHILETTPGVVSFTRRTGAEMGPATATQQNTGDVLVRLAPRGKRASVYDIMDRVRVRAEHEVPELRVEFVQVLQDVLDDLSGNPGPIEVKLLGPEQAELERLAGLAAERLHDMPELEDLFDGVEGNVPVLRFDVAPVRAQALGVTPAEVMDDLSVALAGRVAASVRVGDRNLGVRVRFPDSVRFDADGLANIPLGYGGTTVQLSAVADASRPVGTSVLSRENLSQMVMLTAALHPGTDLDAVTSKVAARLGDLPMPRGYRLEIGGQLASARATQRELGTVFAMGIALVLVVLLVQLRSLRLALVVLLGAPLALVGAAGTQPERARDWDARCQAALVSAVARRASQLQGRAWVMGRERSAR